jgi:PAS domain S-box-containing protein
VVHAIGELSWNIQGKPSVLFGTVQDITERKKAEEKLKESEEKYQTTFESSTDALMLLGENGFFDCNRAALRLFGCMSVEEFTKFHPADLSPPTQPDGTPSKNAAMSHIQKAFQTGTDCFFWIHKRTDGTTFPSDVLLTRMTLTGREVLQATVRDISERKKAEDTLRESEAKLGSIVENSSDQIFMIDESLKYLSANRTLIQVSGKAPEELIGKSISDVYPEETAVRFSNNVKNVFATGKSLFLEEKMVAENQELYVSTSLNPVKDVQGRVIAVAGIVRDITGRKDAERKLKENNHKLELMNEKLLVVGNLTRHDVGNKLTAVNGYTYLLRKKHRDQTDIVEGLGKIEQAIEDSAKIFEFSKLYEKLGVEELSCIDLGKTVDEAVSLLKDLTFEVVNGCHGKNVLADSFLRQMFYNFIDNTRKYGEKTTIVNVYCEEEASGILRLIYEDNGVWHLGGEQEESVF